MQRRNFLRITSGIALTGSLAGCSVLQGSSETETPTDSNVGQNPDPSITWSEERLGGMDYRLAVTVQLNGAETVEIRKGVENTLLTVSKSGTHTVASPDSENGPAEMGRTYYAYVPRDRVDRLIGSHFVGKGDEISIPYFLNGVGGSTDPSLDDTGFIERTYQQDTEIGETKLNLVIPEVLSKYYENRYHTRNYGAYVSDKYDDQYIDSLVRNFERYGERNGLSDIEIINRMMIFTQNLEYTKDRVSSGFDEYPKYPTETLVEKGGDCEDTCILLASMLEQFGYGTVLLAYYDAGHMALGLAGEKGIPGTYVEYRGRRYYYVETTAPGWNVGEAPNDIQSEDPEVIEIDSHPVLVFSYVVNVGGAGETTVEGSIKNVGDAPARDAQLKIEFQDRSKQTIEQGTSSRKLIQPDSEKNVELAVNPPDDTAMRAKATVLLGGSLHDSTTSGYQEPFEGPD